MSKNYRNVKKYIIRIDLYNQTSTTVSQQINVTRNLEPDDGDTVFFYRWKTTKTILNFYSILFFRFFKRNRIT